MSYLKDPRQFFHTPLPQKYSSKNQFFFLKIIIAGSIFGFFSGFVGGLVARTYFFPESFISMNPVLNPQTESFLEENKETGIALLNIPKKEVNLYKKGSIKNIGNFKFFPQSGFLGKGVILTSDGWVVSGVEVKDKKDIALISSDNIVYDVKEIIFDPWSGISFLKAEANNFFPAAFLDIKDFHEGTKAFIFSSEEKKFKNYILEEKSWSSQKNTEIFSSQKLEYFFTLRGAKTDSGDIVWGENGELLGLIRQGGDQNSQMIPFPFVSWVIEDFLQDGKLTLRPLNVSYVSLKSIVALTENISYADGAVVMNTKEFPLAKGIFKGLVEEGDIILSVDGELIRSDSPFEYLLHKKSFQKKELTFLIFHSKDRQEKEIRVPLSFP